MCIEEIYGFFVGLYEKHHEAMIKHAFLCVRNKADAEDIASSCWVELIKHADQLKLMTPSAQAKYIRRSIANATIDFVRKRNSHPEWLYGSGNEEAIENTLVDNGNPEVKVIRRGFIVSLLFLLPPREREVMCLRFENYSVSEIASRMGISETSVRVYTTRAVNRLRTICDSTEDGGFA